jgi:hypothetical protein
MVPKNKPHRTFKITILVTVDVRRGVPELVGYDIMQ